ncbi:hypothetical protein [Fundidesulfovibrio soli]|uniref:hypothetical protein n=1 Tax=Fundidesulfovibrio soli TaxID=2922716 RepID=UPI001FAF7C1C|nr:hypothetical protein [Fundidesulfovibrio soli]
MNSSMSRIGGRLLFDQKDYALLGIVADVLGREAYSGFKHLLTHYLHPRGIKELAASQGLRIAYAAANLLGSLEIGKAHDRIVALRALHDEVMNASVTYLRRNTARVLMQVMKELVRERDPQRQLELAHDFRMAATGKARIIARLLKRYHLLLMPEDWVQLCFDNHVHDANTKGRKSATHLIMDAWIKGIRHLTVIYYNFVQPDVAEELLAAAEIMGITVRVGIEFTTRHGSRQAKIIWVPRGFAGEREFVDFLREPEIEAFMQQGRQLSLLQQEQLLGVLREFNESVLPDFNAYFGLAMQPLDVEGFFTSVGAGQPSLDHLGKYVHAALLPHLRKRVEELQAEHASADAEEQRHIESLIEEMNVLDAEAVTDDYLEQFVSPLRHENGACEHPAIYCPLHTPVSLLDAVGALRVGNRFILNLCGLSPDSVLEILADCGGRITHLEVVNLKNVSLGLVEDAPGIANLLQVINNPSAIALKHWIMARLGALEADGSPEAAATTANLWRILENVSSFHAHYRSRPLRTSIGTDSTGQSCRGFGMGLVADQTLPPSAQAELRRNKESTGRIMTVGMTMEPHLVFEPRESSHPWLNTLYALARRRDSLRFLGYKAQREFRYRDFHPVPRGESNISILGGTKKDCGNNLSLAPRRESARRSLPGPAYLNNSLKNLLKVLCGFIPAFLAFLFTKDWWLLKYFGALIWFGITGVRNVIQSVLGGGGLSRTPLLKWNDYVSWSRLSDSLFYTGFSVPLLDFFVKTLLLEETFGITVGTNPTAVYAIMAFVNGSYICTHNLFRGLPRSAAFWNLLRSVLSIPLAMLFSATVGWFLTLAGEPGAAAILQQWAAVISKLASDSVAAVIEGLADRGNNMLQRLRDYSAKLRQVMAVHERLEMLYPRRDVLQMLADPKRFVEELIREQPELANAIIVNSLDFLYFWMYQPRARGALARTMKELDPQTRQVFISSHYVLLCKREISQLFLDGLVGKNFSKGLAFYLEYADGYLDAVQRLAQLQDPIGAQGQRLEAQDKAARQA